MRAVLLKQPHSRRSGGQRPLLLLDHRERLGQSPHSPRWGRPRQGSPRGRDGHLGRAGVARAALVGPRRLGVQQVAATSPRRRSSTRLTGSELCGIRVACLADGGVSLSRRPGLLNDADRYARLFRRLTATQVVDHLDPAAAAALQLDGYRPSTRLFYMATFCFLVHCTAHACDPLFAAPPTVVEYIFRERQHGRLAPPSLDKYISAIKAVHAIAGLADPLARFLDQLSGLGSRAGALAFTGTLRPQRLPLPATRLLSVGNYGLATSDDYIRIQFAGLCLAYILLNRPGAAACMLAQVLRITDVALEAQLVDYKMALRTGRNRHTLSVPFNQPSQLDRPMQLLRRVLAAHSAAR